MKEFVEKLIGRLEELYDNHGTSAETYKEALIKYVNQLAEEYNNGWIPCSELPQEEDSYIVAWVPEHLPVQCASPHYYGIFVYENGEWSIDVPEEFKNVGIVILAWQPLPEPYQPKGE